MHTVSGSGEDPAAAAPSAFAGMAAEAARPEGEAQLTDPSGGTDALGGLPGESQSDDPPKRKRLGWGQGLARLRSSDARRVGELPMVSYSSLLDGVPEQEQQCCPGQHHPRSVTCDPFRSGMQNDSPRIEAGCSVSCLVVATPSTS